MNIEELGEPWPGEESEDEIELRELRALLRGLTSLDGWRNCFGDEDGNKFLDLIDKHVEKFPL